MELSETVDLMNSEDYKDRLKAEYFQTKIRYDKLHKKLIQKDAGTLNEELSCPRNMLLLQKNAMGQYLNQLEIRAEFEGIDLTMQ